MSDLYKVGIHLAVSSNANAFFSTLGTHLLGIHRHFGRVHDDLAKTEASIGRINRMKLAIGGGIAIVGGIEILKAAGHLETAGEKLVHAQTVLGAGLPGATRAASVLDATAAAWAEAGKNMNTTVTSNIEAIHDLYNVVQDMDHAKGLLPAFNTLQTALSSIKDGSSIGEAASTKNVASAVRAFELMGKTDPHALEGMSRDFVRTTIALRGRVDGGNFLTAVQGAGDSRYGWGNEFATKGFPAMVNAMGTRAGNLMNMLNNNLYGGVASSGIQAGYQIKYGLHRQGDLEANGKAFKPGTVYQAGLLRDNPLAWAGKYREHLKELGVNVDDLKTMQDIVAKIGRGNRSVKAALDELLLPMTNRQLNKEVANIGKVGDDAAGVLQANDPKLLRDALHKQWENLQTAIGEPLVKPAMEALKSLTGVIKDLSQAAAANPGATKLLAEGIVALGAALTTGGVAAVIAAIGPVGWIAAGVTALGAAILKIDPGFFTKLIKNYVQIFDDMKAFNFGALVKDIGKLFNDGMLGLPALILPAITEVFSKIGAAIKAAVEGMLSGGILGGGKPTGEMPSGLPGQPSSYEGSGIDPSLIHKSSIVRGGGANDNGPLKTPVVRGAAGLGTGAGDTWHEAVMRAEGTSGKDPYNTVLGYGKYGRPGKPITEMTLAEVYAFGREVRRRHGSASAMGAFQIVGRTMKAHMKAAGLGPHDLFSPENQRKLADDIRRTEGLGAWEGFKSHPGERARAQRGRPLNPITSSTPVAREPAQSKQPVIVHTALHVDGKKMASVISQHQADGMLFPKKAGGMDTHGEWRCPGTPVMDAA